MSTNFEEVWSERRELIEEALKKELHEGRELDATLTKSMEYSLMAGGKRLRPILLMAAADACGKDGRAFITSACALEMIHTYSLIHDDLPAMDDDNLRRGKPTNHVKFGAGMATLAGDGLLTMAFEVLTREKNVRPETILSVIREVSVAAGTSGMVGGQAIDLESEGRRIDLTCLRRMHMGKTGALFRAALRTGAILAGASEKELAALTQYAEAFGLAFQITDDILDVTGSEAEIGKPVGSDRRNEKSTYVTLTSLARAQELADEAIESALSAVEIFGEKASFLQDLVRFLSHRRS
jgi:geranyltranstransferase